MSRDDLLTAIDHRCESDTVEYKSSFDKSNAAWLEIVKDVVAIANSGGGAIFFGLSDSGEVLHLSDGLLAGVDPADLTNKIYAYTDQQFAGFSFVELEKDGYPISAILIQAAPVPMVFSKLGNYLDVTSGKQKNAFGVGTVYFRHGAKSEPGTSDDLRLSIDRRIEEVRKSWFEGIVRVVEAPLGSEVRVVPPSAESESSIRLVNDPAAPAFRQVSVDETHPYRQKEVVVEINRRLNGTKSIKSYNIQCVRGAHGIDSEPTFCYTQKYMSARFSDAFIDWILAQLNAEPDFFENAKVAYESKKRSLTAIA